MFLKALRAVTLAADIEPACNFAESHAIALGGTSQNERLPPPQQAQKPHVEKGPDSDDVQCQCGPEHIRLFLG
jgi:hypothetical protein